MDEPAKGHMFLCVLSFLRHCCSEALIIALFSLCAYASETSEACCDFLAVSRLFSDGRGMRM